MGRPILNAHLRRSRLRTTIAEMIGECGKADCRCHFDTAEKILTEVDTYNNPISNYHSDGSRVLVKK